MKNKEFHKLLKKNRSKSNSGFTLVELLVGLFLSVFVIGALGFGLMQILEATQTSGEETEVRNESSRALDFVSDELRSAQAIEVDMTTGAGSNLSTVAPSFTLPTGGTVRLALQVPGVSERIIYSVAPPQTGSPWKGPLVIYRWGPTLKADGSYQTDTSVTGHVNDASNWDNTALVDAVSDVTQSLDCDGDGTDETYQGFFACVVDNDADAFVETADSNGDGFVLAVAQDVDGDGTDEDADTATVDADGNGTINSDDLDANQDGEINSEDNADADGISISAQLYFSGGTATGQGDTYSADTQAVARARTAPDNNSEDLSSYTMSFRTLNPSFSCRPGPPAVNWQMRTDFGESSSNPSSLTQWNHDPTRPRQPQPIKVSGNTLAISSIPRGASGDCLNSRVNNGRESTNPTDPRDYSGNKSLSEDGTWREDENVVAITHVIDFGDPTTFNGDIKNTCDANGKCGGSIKVNDSETSTMNTSVMMLKRGSIVPDYGGYDANNNGDRTEAGDQPSLGEFLASKGLAKNIGTVDSPQYEIISVQDTTPGAAQILGKDERIIAFEVGYEVNTVDTTPNTNTSPGIDFQDNIFVVQSNKFQESQFDSYSVP